MLRLLCSILLVACSTAPLAGAQFVTGLPAPGAQGLLAPGDRYEGVYTADGVSNGAQDFALWLPESPPPPQGYPLAIFVPGGGWREPGPHGPEPTGLNRVLRRRGFAVARVRYSHSDLPGPTAGRFPAAEQDVQAALQHFRFHAATYRIDPARVFLNGRSAGAHSVQAAALWPDAADLTATDQRRESSRPTAVLLGSLGATHIPTLRQFVNSPIAAYLNGTSRLSQVPQARQVEASPTTWIADRPDLARQIPFFIVSSPRAVEAPLGQPFALSAADHNHDPWNALTLWFLLRGTGGAQATHSFYLDTSAAEIENAQLFEYQALWIDYILELQARGLLAAG